MTKSLGELKPITTIPKGRLVMFTTGEYSDYYVSRLLRCRRDFTHEDMLDAIHVSGSFTPERGRYGEFDEDKLLDYLSTHAAFEPVDSIELHLGDYGRLSLDERSV